MLNNKEAFARLRQIGRNIIPKAGKVIIIPKDQFKIACSNKDFHGNTHTTICFRPGITQGGKVVRKAVTEETCSCGIVYKQEN